MRRRTLVAATALVVSIGARGSAPAQSTAPESRVELVQLDVVVTDAAGKLVRDLARDDFEVLEDGKPQRLAQFLVVTRAAASAPATAPPPTGETTAPGMTVTPALAPPGPPRRIVIVVDDLHIARGNIEYAKEALGRVVDEFVAPDDLVALVTTASGPKQQFTLDRVSLRAAITGLTFREAPVAPARNSRMTPAQAELILRGDRNALLLAAKTMVDEPGSIYNAMSPQVAAAAAAGGSPAASTGTDAERAAEKDAERQARAILGESLRFSNATLGAVEDVLRSMARLPGRKICLLVSDGFLVGTGTSEERTREMQGLIDAATRSGGVVYAVDTHGLVPTGGDAGVTSSAAPGLQSSIDRQSEQLFRQTLRGVTDATGGFLVYGTNDLAAGMHRMLEDNDAYYLLAYEPTNTKHDGRFRKIEVRLPHRHDVTIRTRKGYFATDDRKRPSGLEASAGGASAPVSTAVAPAVAPSLVDAEARAMLSAPLAGAIDVRLAADYLELPPSGPQAVVRATVEVGGLRFHESEGHHQATLDLVGGVFDAKGEPVGSPFGRRLELDLSVAEYKQAAEAGLDYQQRVPLRPGRYQVRFVAHELTLAQTGGASQWIDIPDIADKKFAMSGVFLTAITPGGAGGGAASGELLREANTRRRFARGGSFSFQLYLYNPAVDEKGTSDVVLQAQVWSAGKAVAASKPQPAGLRQKDGVPLPETNVVGLEGLAAGHYDLRVVAVDRKANATIFRNVDFTVE